jgi:hypothetical protein
MVDEHARKVHNILRELARSPSESMVQRHPSDGRPCDVCRREIRVGAMEHVVTTSFARMRLDDSCLVIWTRERKHFLAERLPGESEERS